MKHLETSLEYKETIESFTAPWEPCCSLFLPWMVWHLVWHLDWAEIDEGGQVRRWVEQRRVRKSDSFHKCWVQTFNHFSYIIQQRPCQNMDEASHWSHQTCPSMVRGKQSLWSYHDKQLLVSFSTRFTTTADDAVNAERVAKVRREMQIKLDRQSVTSTMEVKFKVQALSSLKKIPKVSEKKIHINSLKLFNWLIVIAQRDMTVETSLEYVLTPFPLSLFSNKD